MQWDGKNFFFLPGNHVIYFQGHIFKTNIFQIFKIEQIPKQTRFLDFIICNRLQGSRFVCLLTDLEHSFQDKLFESTNAACYCSDRLPRRAVRHVKSGVPSRPTIHVGADCFKIPSMDGRWCTPFTSLCVGMPAAGRPRRDFYIGFLR